MTKRQRDKKKKQHKSRIRKRKVHKVKLFNIEISYETLFKWITIIILAPLIIQSVGKLIKFPFIIYFISEYVFFFNFFALFIIFLIVLIYTKSYLKSSKSMIAFILIISIFGNTLIVKDVLIPMTKDISAIITGRYIERKFYIMNIKGPGHKNVITSEYVTAKDTKTGEIVRIEFYYSSNIDEGEYKLIRYLPNSKKGITSYAVSIKP